MSKNFFGPLQELRERLIPDLSDMRAKKPGYRSHAIDTQQALYNEPLVDLATLGIDGINHYFQTDNPPYYEKFSGSINKLLLRKSVAEKLAAIDRRLRAQGLKLFVHDAYRPTEVQEYAHDVWMPNELQKRNPSLSGESLTAAVEQFWARPTRDASSPSPHKTGATVDLTLAYVSSGQTMFMGTIFDDVSEIAYTDSFEARIESASYSDQEAIGNLRLLYWIMTEAGFVNYPAEWWHYSWGDQMWARFTNAPAAFYGPADP